MNLLLLLAHLFQVMLSLLLLPLFICLEDQGFLEHGFLFYFPDKSSCTGSGLWGISFKHAPSVYRINCSCVYVCFLYTGFRFSSPSSGLFKKIFITFSGSPSVKNGFSDLTKEQVGQDQQGKTSQMIIKENLSKKVVMKENGLGWVFLQERQITLKGT